MVYLRVPGYRARHWRFDCEATAIRKYMELTRESLTRVYDEFLAEFRSRNPAGSEKETEDSYSIHREEFFHFEDRFPAISSISTFLAISSLFEDHMRYICVCVRDEMGLSTSPKEHGTDGKSKHQIYLEQVCGVAYPATDEAKRVNVYRKIRNIFSHGTGTVRKKLDKDVQEFVEHSKVATLAGSELILTLDFCSGVLDDMDAFLNQLDKVVPAK